IKEIHATPHDRVKPGEPLFTVQIISEPLLNSQAAHYKNRRELDLTLTLFHQIEDLVKENASSKARLIELDHQVQRLSAALETSKHERKMRGLSKEQTTGVAKGTFVTEITVKAPEPVKGHLAEHGAPASHNHGKPEQFYYEMEELKTLVGEQIAPGQTL